MRLLTRAILGFLVFLYKQLGINAILVVILFVEILCCTFYYSDNSSFYRIADNLKLIQVTSFTPVFYEELPESEKEYYSDYKLYYLANVEIGNYYYTADNIPSLSAEDQNGDSIHPDYYDYYSEYEELVNFPKVEGRTTIPAGTSVVVPYLFHILDFETENIESISFYFYDVIYEQPNIEKQMTDKLRITAPFTPWFYKKRVKYFQQLCFLHSLVFYFN